jgi:hypothetical protein
MALALLALVSFGLNPGAKLQAQTGQHEGEWDDHDDGDHDGEQNCDDDNDHNDANDDGDDDDQPDNDVDGVPNAWDSNDGIDSDGDGQDADDNDRDNDGEQNCDDDNDGVDTDGDGNDNDVRTTRIYAPSSEMEDGEGEGSAGCVAINNGGGAWCLIGATLVVGAIGVRTRRRKV